MRNGMNNNMAKLHIDEQTVDIDSGRISIIFNLIENKPMIDEKETTTVTPEDSDAPVETPTDGSDVAASDAGVQAPLTESEIESGEVNG